MTRSASFLFGALLSSLAVVGCNGDSPTDPGTPVFLSGVWSGTISLHVAEEEPPVEGEMSCLFTPIASDEEPRVTAACSIQSEWLTTNFAGEMTLDDVEPPASFHLDTTYRSPRDCTGSLSLSGQATANRVTATANGVDCDDVPWTANLLLAEAP
ncbi:MAG: hypothetical protein GEU99_18435 [Luteitalea sp.]|nr:hypothetical protein [Luteitalea sp.]